MRKHKPSTRQWFSLWDDRSDETFEAQVIDLLKDIRLYTFLFLVFQVLT